MRHKLPRGLYALVDDSLLRGRSALDVVAAAARGGARVLQLRLEQTADRPALELVRGAVARCAPLGVPVLVNDRVDLALAGGAAGVHLGADDLPVPVARRLLGPEALIGATARTLADVEAAAAAGADHVGLGPIFATRTKVVPHERLGLEGLAAVAQRSPLPVVAIAGITLETIGAVAERGAWCAAVAGDLLGADDIEARAGALQRAFSGAP